MDHKLKVFGQILVKERKNMDRNSLLRTPYMDVAYK